MINKPIKIRNYSYSLIDLTHDIKNYQNNRKLITKALTYQKTDNYYLKKLEKKYESMLDTNKKSIKFLTKLKLLNTIICVKKNRNFRDSDMKLINFLQKRFEVDKKIYESYKNNLVLYTNMKNYNEIDTLSLLSYILMMAFKLNRNYSYLSTSLKISDFIRDNYNKNKICQSIPAGLMFLHETKLINRIYSD